MSNPPSLPSSKDSATIKLQVFLAHAGVASRRKCEEIISAGKVQVNGQVAHLGQRVTPSVDTVTLSGKKISATKQKTVTYLIYKPVGVVSTTSDELGRKNVVQFLQEQLGASVKLPRLYPVGRLDLDSEGLMILSNDGDLTQKITHPSFEVQKTYEVIVNGFPTERALNHLRKGVLLKEGYTSPAEVEFIKGSAHESTLHITIHEGRYHQVKRMMLRVGYEVKKLIRTRLEEYTIDDLAGQKFKLL